MHFSLFELFESKELMTQLTGWCSQPQFLIQHLYEYDAPICAKPNREWRSAGM